MTRPRRTPWDYLDWIAAFSLMLYLSFAAYGLAFAAGSAPFGRASLASAVALVTLGVLLKFRSSSRGEE